MACLDVWQNSIPFPNEKTIKIASKHVRHSQLNATAGEKNAWSPVWSAGELWIENGEISAISNESGHFKPDYNSLTYVLDTLDYFDIPVAGKNILYDITKHKSE